MHAITMPAPLACDMRKVRGDRNSSAATSGRSRWQLTHSLSPRIVSPRQPLKAMPSGARIVRIRIEELLSINLVVGDRLLAFG